MQSLRALLDNRINRLFFDITNMYKPNRPTTSLTSIHDCCMVCAVVVGWFGCCSAALHNLVIDWNIFFFVLLKKKEENEGG